MQILIGGFPGAAITILVAEDFSEDNFDPIVRESVWYDDFIPTMTSLIEEHEVKTINFFGATDFVVGLAQQLSEFVDDDVELIIITPDAEEEQND